MLKLKNRFNFSILNGLFDGSDSTGHTHFLAFGKPSYPGPLTWTTLYAVFTNKWNITWRSVHTSGCDGVSIDCVC